MTKTTFSNFNFVTEIFLMTKSFLARKSDAKEKCRDKQSLGHLTCKLGKLWSGFTTWQKMTKITFSNFNFVTGILFLMTPFLLFWHKDLTQ